MNTRFDLFQILLEYSGHDDRIDLMLKNASSGKDFTRSVGLDGAAQRRARNDALVRASDFLIPENCGPFKRAEKLSEAVVRFRKYIWPRIKRGAQFDLLPHEVWLRRAFLADKDVPDDAVYLYKSLFK